jgi:hypothetical protein
MRRGKGQTMRAIMCWRPIGVTLAFGMILSACASSDPGTRDAGRAQDDSRRNVYSADIADDPYVQRQWESGLGALEARCRETGEFCADAERLRETVRRVR